MSLAEFAAFAPIIGTKVRILPSISGSLKWVAVAMILPFASVEIDYT